MSKIRFEADKSTVYDATIIEIGNNQLRIEFQNATKPESDDIIISGFVVLNENNGAVIRNCTDFIYIYRETGDTYKYELDNDNIPYVPVEVPEEEIWNMSEQERKMIQLEYEADTATTIFDMINAKKSLFSESCRESIETPVKVIINGNEELFSYSLIGGDQNNIDDIFNIMMSTGKGQSYHADGGACKEYAPRDIFNIYVSQKLKKLEATTYYNQLVQYMVDTYGEMETTEENLNSLRELKWSTIDQLPEGYQNNYHLILSKEAETVNIVKARLEQLINPVPDTSVQDHFDQIDQSIQHLDDVFEMFRKFYNDHEVTIQAIQEQMSRDREEAYKAENFVRELVSSAINSMYKENPENPEEMIAPTTGEATVTVNLYDWKDLVPDSWLIEEENSSEEPVANEDGEVIDDRTNKRVKNIVLHISASFEELPEPEPVEEPEEENNEEEQPAE